ncbi:hypothetical protein WNX29_10420, partial [Limosilactobacillus reuteri]|uniref:hypothetical protein n=1 Tax=Limosilactobacillus reuteri TaxID=1598 RepID=UPI0030EAEA45
ERTMRWADWKVAVMMVSPWSAPPIGTDARDFAAAVPFSNRLFYRRLLMWPERSWRNTPRQVA